MASHPTVSICVFSNDPTLRAIPNKSHLSVHTMIYVNLPSNQNAKLLIDDFIKGGATVPIYRGIAKVKLIVQLLKKLRKTVSSKIQKWNALWDTVKLVESKIFPD